ncbi:hypothetical protein [Candidatus Enterococcus ferrettii]|uniref:Uncharacterized protein n=1 Tax=Candidatus Enterococcus ferrettii TaxID=2815324 RepID=A0ABV0EP37_9ENTE
MSESSQTSVETTQASIVEDTVEPTTPADNSQLQDSPDFPSEVVEAPAAPEQLVSQSSDESTTKPSSSSSAAENTTEPSSSFSSTESTTQPSSSSSSVTESTTRPSSSSSSTESTTQPSSSSSSATESTTNQVTVQAPQRVQPNLAVVALVLKRVRQNLIKKVEK